MNVAPVAPHARWVSRLGHQASRSTGQRAWMAREVMSLPSPSPVSLQTPREPGRVSCRSLEEQHGLVFLPTLVDSSGPPRPPTPARVARVYHWQGAVRRAQSRPQPPAHCPGTGELQQSRSRMQLHQGASQTQSDPRETCQDWTGTGGPFILTGRVSWEHCWGISRSSR